MNRCSLPNIPLFQFAIFYNVNLEICPGQPMVVSGPVFCNQSIWEGSGNVTFSSTVTAVGTNDTMTGANSDPFASNYGPQSGVATFQTAGQPVDHANALVMPIGTNNSPGAVLGLLQLPPSSYAMGTAAAYSSNGMAYPANAADLVITNFVSGTNDGGATVTGTNLMVYFQDSGLTQVPYDFYTLKTGGTTNWVSQTLSAGRNAYTNVLFAGFTWVTNTAFYDWREGWNGGSGPAKRVEAVQIDMNLLNKWLTNTLVPSSASGASQDTLKNTHSGHHIDSIYVYTSVALTTAQLPAVRVVNGAALPTPGGSTAGFTVATPFPMYVLGNYNSQDSTGSALGKYGTNGATAHTLPAALMADAVTILSPVWNDGTSSIKDSGGPTAASSGATVNAAMLEGIVQTDPNMLGRL